MDDSMGRWVLGASTVPFALWVAIAWPDLLLVIGISSILIPDAWKDLR